MTALAPPDFVETLDYEAILGDLKAAVRAALPEWDTGDLESDPLTKVLEALAYREMSWRQRVNDAARSTLLAYAAGADLDQVADFYGVTRLPGESDDALRQRTRERIIGWSTAGGRAHYRYHALSVAGVADAAVWSPEPGRVRIAVYGAAGDGTPAPELLDAVRAVVAADDVRVLTDTVDVVPVTIVPAAVVASIWTTPDGQVSAQALETQLRAAVDAARSLGWDLTRSWLIAQLHRVGVQSVAMAAPAADVVVADDQVVRLDDVTLTMEGPAR